MKEHIEGPEISAFLDGALSAEDRVRAAAHVSSCASCRAELDSLRHLKATLAAAPRKTMPADLALTLERRLVSGRTWWAGVLRPAVWVPAGTMAAAALLVGFWLRAGSASEEIPLGPLLEAHARYNAETLVPDFLPLDQLRQLTGTKARIPDRLEGGFIFESADSFNVGKRRVTHVRYTDGLTIVSLFLTDRPVRLPKSGVIAKGPTPLPGTLRASRAGKVLHWRIGPRHYTLVGDVSRELLGDIAKSLH